MNRKIFISVAFIFAALSLASCQREPAVQPITEADKTIPSYHVPREKALAELNSFLADVDANNTTRGGKIRQIKDVTPILGDKFQNATRVSEDEAAAAIDTLLYLVNFEDEEGYAVLSAADFLAPIIAVMDQGSIDSSMMESIAGSIWDFDDDDCCIDYYEDELEEEAADTTDLPIIGDPIYPPLIGGGLLSQSNEITRTTESTSAVNHNVKFVLRMVNDYCEFKLIDHNNPAGSGDNSGGNTGGVSGDNGSGDNSGDESGDNGGSTSPQDWVTISQVQPMLQTSWIQQYPYNYYCPSTSGVASDCRGRGYAGCLAVALGQILAYHQYPTVIDNVYAPVWLAIRTNVWVPPTNDFIYIDYGTDQVAILLSELGRNKYLDMKYTKSGSSSNSRKAYKTLEKLGYQNTGRTDGYDQALILTHLNTDRPVLIGATSPKEESGDGKKHGHTWVIDGYIHRLRGSQSEIMMHCNMGWGGQCDGYYVSSLFDTTQVRNENGEILPPIPNINPANYCKNYRIVYYDKPTNN